VPKYEINATLLACGKVAALSEESAWDRFRAHVQGLTGSSLNVTDFSIEEVQQDDMLELNDEEAEEQEEEDIVA